MKTEDMYPGRLLYRLKIVRGERSGDYELTDSSGEENPNRKYHLESKYCSSNMEELEVGDIIDGPFVVLSVMKDGRYEVALDNYSQKLYNLIYPNGWNTVVYKTPWTEHWKKLFQKDFDQKSADLSKLVNNCCLELKMPWAVMPIRVSSFAKHIQGSTILFPDNLLSNKKKEYHQYAAYRSDADISWPLSYSGKLKIDKNTIKNVKILLHGFIDPLQHHYKLWKHLTDDKRVSNYPGSVKRWNAYTGMNVPATLQNIIFKECSPPSSPKQRRCNDDCPENCFTDVNRKISSYKKKYMKQAVTFFEKCPTNNIVYICNVHNNQYVKEFCDLRFYDSADCPGEETRSIIRLFLKGYCYNWNVRDEIPLIHLHFVTFYIGPDDEKPFPCYFNVKEYKNKTVLAVGNFSEIKEVK